MRRFVAEQNIRRFKRMLEEEMDSGQSTLLRDLLAEAEQELAEATREFEALEEAARLGDAGALPIANDECEPERARRSPCAGSR